MIPAIQFGVLSKPYVNGKRVGGILESWQKIESWCRGKHVYKGILYGDPVRLSGLAIQTTVVVEEDGMFIETINSYYRLGKPKGIE